MVTEMANINITIVINYEVECGLSISAFRIEFDLTWQLQLYFILYELMSLLHIQVEFNLHNDDDGNFRK